MSIDNVEDIYRLSPVQEGMLFHTLYDSLSSVYVEQVVITLEGNLQVPSFEKAWNKLLQRHSILRSSFVWEGVENPVHVIHREVRMPIRTEDWSHLSAEQQQDNLKSLTENERKRGFDLTEPPLLRLSILNIGSGSHWIVWSFHHSLLDGWSFPLVLQEALTLYEEIARGKDPLVEPSPSYGEFIEWLQRQDLDKAESFWREKLKGFSVPTPLPMRRNGHN